MNKELNEILTGIKRAVGLLNIKEKRNLIFATLIMFITGILTNLPAVILGKLVDGIVGTKTIQFSSITPFILLIITIIFVREALTVLRKYLVENIATQTDQAQTVK